MNNLLKINRAHVAKKQKLFTLLLFIVSSIGTMFASEIINGIAYNLDDTNYTAEVTSGGNYSGSIAIPASIQHYGTYRVTSIRERAFRNCTGLTSVTIPNSVTSIAYETFFGCSSLRSVTIPNSVTNIGRSAFCGCSSLTSVTIPNSVTSIESYVFSGCTGLTSVTIPNSVTSIGYCAFSGCTRLTSPVYNTNVFAYLPISYSGAYTIPNGITSIAGGAFSGCTGLTSVTIPNRVTSIGDDAFRGCTGLTSVTIPNRVTSIEYGTFSGCSSLTSVTIPNSVTSIGENAFYDCSGLTSVTIGNGVTSIGVHAFWYCSSLTSVHISNLVAWCGISYDGDPWECAHNLYLNGEIVTDLVIPSSITSIGNLVFSYCSSLTSVTIGNSVTSIGSYAFWNSRGLTSVTIGDSVTSIGEKAFWNCTSLTSVTIPNSVTSIRKGAFQNCTGLTSIEIPNSVTSIGDFAFENCIGLTSVTCYNSTPLVLPTRYGFNYAGDCKGLFYGVNCSQIPLYVPYESMDLYKAAAQWKDFKIKSIEGHTITFNNWDGTELLVLEVLKDSIPVYIGDTPTRLEDGGYIYTFTGWTPEIVPATEDATYTATYSVAPVVHYYTVTANASHGVVTGTGRFAEGTQITLEVIPDQRYLFDRWSDGDTNNPRTFVLTQDTTFTAELAVKCGDDLVWDLTDSVLTISGSGAMYDYYSTTTPWHSQRANIKMLKINLGATSIGEGAFRNCTSLTSVTIPNSVTSIRKGAFQNCTGLTSIEIPNSVTSIGDIAFENCIGLTSVTIGNSVTSIAGGAFSGCSGLTSVDIPNSVTSIGNYAFCDCSGLTSVTIGNSVTSIGNYAFMNSTGLTSVTIGNSVTSIGECAFYRCSGLTSVTIPNSVISIGDLAFWKSTGLTSVTIGNSVTSIGECAFCGCPGLAAVTMESTTPPTLGINCFDYFEFLDDGTWNYHIPDDIYVPCGSLDAYKAEEGWNGYISKIKNAPLPYFITINAENGYVITPQNSCDSLKLNAIPNYGYYFTQWSDGNTDNPRTIILTQDTTFTALFAINQYAITVSCDAQHGSIEGENGTFNYGTELTYKATANENYHFVQWSDGVKDNPRTIVLTHETSLFAEFAINSYLVQFFGFNNVLLDSQSIEHGAAAVAPEAPQIDHYDFVGWDKEFKNVTSNLDIFAIYQQNTEDIENANIDSQPYKVMIDDQIFILRGDKTYTLQGQEVK